MSRPVGIALIGMGWWGKKMLTVLGAAPSDIRVVRAIEPNLDTARALCADKGVALTADYVDALTDPEVEAVVLATPHAIHGAQIEAAVAAGKHV
ncbi:MAG TPA: Gfo/Idh/MocA family oxidoreductase, partial [Roseiarcus sp.]